MTHMEKWRLIVSEVQKNYSSKESEVQRLWENFLADAGFFGYSKYNGEIDSQRKIPIGAGDRVIPDIIVRDASQKKDLFLIELKQHNLPYHPHFKGQLFSYMRLLSLSVGILICDKIYVYVLEHDGHEISLEIVFAKENESGGKFIELFEKGGFNEEKVRGFIEKANLFETHVREIRKDISTLPIKELIKDHYAERFSEEEIDSALQGLNVTVARNAPSVNQTVPAPRVPSDPPHSHNDYYEEPQEDYIIIKTSKERVDFCGGSIYEATRYAWKAKFERVQQYRYVFGVIGGIVKGVYIVDEWYLVQDGVDAGRVAFHGHDAPEAFASRFLGKRIPPQYSQKGSASPLLYKRKQ